MPNKKPVHPVIDQTKPGPGVVDLVEDSTDADNLGDFANTTAPHIPGEILDWALEEYERSVSKPVGDK